MLYKVGTVNEIIPVQLSFPEVEELFIGISMLDSEYGTDRNYIETGGYSILLETKDDLDELREIIDYDDYPSEWVNQIGNTGYISALFILNDDYSIEVFMPLEIAPEVILNDLEVYS